MGVEFCSDSTRTVVSRLCGPHARSISAISTAGLPGSHFRVFRVKRAHRCDFLKQLRKFRRIAHQFPNPCSQGFSEVITYCNELLRRTAGSMADDFARDRIAKIENKPRPVT